MFEQVNLLIKFKDIKKGKIKYFPIDSDTEIMKPSELIKLAELENPFMTIVYNDNNKSKVSRENLIYMPSMLYKAEVETPEIWEIALYQIMYAIRTCIFGLKYYNELDIESRNKIIEQANKAEYIMYLIFGEEEKENIINKIEKTKDYNELYDIINELNIKKDKNGQISHIKRRINTNVWIC